ncbi:hypothetical protein LBMAG53_38240 [Planctomycetota bacterium]|nr:hypothetical protein LBMAG53_38240 [Planctomycetota bacterium]
MMAAPIYAGETYFVDDGISVTLYQGDPSQIQAQEWHIRLYRAGDVVGGPNRWGLIIGKSPEDVLKQLHASQESQKIYNAWAGRNYLEDPFTYFNPMGPIAKVKRAWSLPTTSYARFQSALDRVLAMRDLLTKADAFAKGQALEGPLRNFGSVLMDYAGPLMHAQEQLRKLQLQLTTALNTGADVTDALAEIEQDLAKVDVATPALQAHFKPAGDGLKLETLSGDRQVIPFGEFKNISVRVVDYQGSPVAGAKVGWQMPGSGKLVFVSITDDKGISTATNLYTFSSDSTANQRAFLVDQSTELGFHKDGIAPSPTSPTLTITISFEKAPGQKPAWATEAGKDQYGTWADLTVGGVTQRMRLIKAGTFQMGSPADEAGRYGDETQHQVTLTKDYWLGDSEVTQGLWQAVVGNNPANFKGADLPVEQVSWDDCRGFFGKLNGLVRSGGFTFPTEAQCEYGCRAGTISAYAGDVGGLAWFRDNAGGTTHAVKTKGANAWGLFDMHGNVLEWCGDWYGDYPVGAARDPAGPASGSDRVYRGGGWFSLARGCRAAFRFRNEPGYRRSTLGFRLSAPVQAGP